MMHQIDKCAHRCPPVVLRTLSCGVDTFIWSPVVSGGSAMFSLLMVALSWGI